MPGRPRRRERVLMGLPSVVERSLPRGWSDWDSEAKLQWLVHGSLEQVACVIAWDINQLDIGHLSIWHRVVESLWKTSLNIGIEANRSRENAVLMEKLERGLAERGPVNGRAEGC